MSLPLNVRSMTNEVTYVAQSAAHELYNVFGTIASGVFASVNIASLRRVRVVSQIKELPLAHVGFSFPRLSFDTWDQGEQIFAMTDAIAERARKLGGATFDQLGRSRALSASRTNDAEYVRPLEMLAERRDAIPVQNMREIHSLATRQGT